VIVNIACDLEELLFINVEAVVLALEPLEGGELLCCIDFLIS
jgi:hypothetical protein